MDETLGKRIVSNRKRLGITQDRLAEQLGVTAQAVSKWENDQSCPDITMLPKLAEIFGTTTDALLGIAPAETPKTLEAEVVTEDPDDESGHNWEVRLDAGRKGSISLAVWIILTAGSMFVAQRLQVAVTFWDLLWTNGLLVFGLFGLFPKFSFFRLGCTLFGAYFLLDKLNAAPFFSRDLLLPAFLLLFGLSLLADALRKPHRPHFSVIHNGRSVANSDSGCNMGEDSFDIGCSFSEQNYPISLPSLRQGDADVSFGHLTVDLTQVGSFAPNCTVDANCAFGLLTVLVPRHIRAQVNQDAAFGAVEIRGCHAPETDANIYIDADASFGQIVIQYI